MKPDAEPDPFDDDDEDEADDTENAADPFATEPTSTDMAESPAETTQQQSTQNELREMPYVLTRDTVKDCRKEIQYYLREEYRDLDEQVQRVAQDELGVDLPVTDVREAMVRVAAEHSDEVVEILREDGYRFKE
jgi:molecular chaperone GrpE (heat shock protein)